MSPLVDRLKEDAVAAFRAAVATVQPATLLPRVVRLRNGELEVFDDPLPRAPGRRVVFAIGKAAPTLADAWIERVGDWSHELVVLTPHGVPVPDRVESKTTVLRGAHPYPDGHGEAATRLLLAIASGLGADDLLLVLLSGGGSALLAAPAEGLDVEDVRATTRALLRAGAPIEAVNTVRRQLLAAAGGGLAAAAAPARVETLVLSDVLGDPLPAIASGPTVPSPTAAGDALEVLARYDLRRKLPQAVSELLERRSSAPTGPPAWAARSRIRILANNRTAVDAAASELELREYRTIVHPGHLEGEASARGRQLAGLATALRPARPTAFVLGGETTVTVRGSGRGGRNHELALAAAIELEGAAPCAVLSAGTDGVDGLADAAGAVVDPETTERLVRAGVDPARALAENDSGTALGAVGAAIVTGPTGTNVCDLTAVLVAGRP